MILHRFPSRNAANSAVKISQFQLVLTSLSAELFSKNHSLCCRKREENTAQNGRELHRFSSSIPVKYPPFSNEKRAISRILTPHFVWAVETFFEQFECRLYISDGVRLNVGRGNSGLFAEQPGHPSNRILHRFKPEGAIGGRPFCAPPA